MRRDKKEVRSGQEAGFSAEPTPIDMQSSSRSLDETARQTSTGRRIVGVLASGLGRRSSSHYSPTDSPNSPSLLVKRQFAFPILALLAVAALGLWLLLPGGALRAQDAAIEYAENGTDPVATYTAVDPEGSAIVSWTLSGDDAGGFAISSVGVLTFAKTPNFEKPADDGADNLYKVIVHATDGTRNRGMTKEVTIEVTNVDEAGKVTLSALQPQSATELTASHSDPDGGVSDLTWEWERSMSSSGGFTVIEDEISSAYTPVDDDVDYFLRAKASYTDKEGSDKSAMVVSDYVVQRVRGTNNAPVFPDQDTDTALDQSETATRMVAENTKAGQAIGNPVAAEDKDGDVLTYTLFDDETDSGDSTAFTIDPATGQLKTKGDLEFDGEDAQTSYIVVVKATDPAGVPIADPRGADPVPMAAIEATSDMITVTIEVTDVNDPPEVMGTGAVKYPETTGETMQYMAEDPEDDTLDVTWTLAGDDAGVFDITLEDTTNGNGVDGGLLTFKEDKAPNFEKPGDANEDNVYEVTVVAADPNGNRDTMAVKVTVTNENEPGKVKLSKVQPRVGIAVKATLTDPDGSISGLTWQWSRSAAEEGTYLDIDGAKSDTYTPVAVADDTDVAMFLRATATYTDAEGATVPGNNDMDVPKTAVGTSDNAVEVDTRNRAPVFVDQDTETDGVQNASAVRMVEENAKTGVLVGSVVQAKDPDPNTDSLVYTLGGPDASLFTVTSDDAGDEANDVAAVVGGQIKVKSGTKLDYETKDTYMVTVTAVDSFDLTATIDVTIMVQDLDEAPKITGDVTAEYAENGTDLVATYTAVDPEGSAIVSWTLAGDDAGDFAISSVGVLTFVKLPNFEKAVDKDKDNLYKVVVHATDATRNRGMTKGVTIEVTNVDEAGKVTLSALRPQSATALTASHSDPDGGVSDPTWEWARSKSSSRGFTVIEDEISTAYTPDDDDIDYFLRAKISYADKEGSGKSAMVVSDYAVQGVRGASSYKAPVFPDQDTEMGGDQSDNATRMVAENTKAGQAIGNPVAAEDKDGDVLTYTLFDDETDNSDADDMTPSNRDGDSTAFTIDPATGQLRTKGALDLEVAGDVAGKAAYMVVVKATDPAGVPMADSRLGADQAAMDAIEATSDTIMVTITVTAVNDPPEVMGTGAVKYPETTGVPMQYMAEDPEPGNAIVTWTLAGDDAGVFDITLEDTTNGNGVDGGLLTFKEDKAPNFEKPGDANEDNVYEVTVVAADPDGNRDTMAVRVTIMNENEDGKVKLSKVQPRVGIAVKATLTDPDGSISGLSWQWSSSTTVRGTYDPIPGATSDTYTPVADDAEVTGAGAHVAMFLRATATYTDAAGDTVGEIDNEMPKTAVGTSDNAVEVDTRNRAPEFVDQDTETDGVQNTSAVRMVEENAKTGVSVGSVVQAKDPDPNTDPLVYTLGGADAGLFSVTDDDPDDANDVADGGQITVKSGTKLDYETRTTYMVTVTAEDSFGLTATIDVTIMVQDLDEPPKISEGGLAISGMMSVDYAENGTDAVATYDATGPESASASWTLSGDDAGDFSISNSGELTFKSAPDYENAADDGTDNVYMVTVEADDDTYTATHNVVVTVTDVEDDAPVIDDPVALYDTNIVDGKIDRTEVLAAVSDYFSDDITADVVLAVVAQYFSDARASS